MRHLCLIRKKCWQYADEFRHTLFNGLDEKNDIHDLLSYLNPSEESWLTEAIRLYGLGMYQQASDYLRKYALLKEESLGEDYEKYRTLSECQLLLQESKDPDDWRHCAEMFELLGDYSSARYVYDRFLDDRFSVFKIDLRTGCPEHYLINPGETSKMITSASISDEDAKIIINSRFIEKQVNHIFTGASTVLEALKNV